MPDNITLQRILNRTTPNPFDITENILSFYRLVIELERSKEPDFMWDYLSKLEAMPIGYSIWLLHLMI